jgi:hypothetical protein
MRFAFPGTEAKALDVWQRAAPIAGHDSARADDPRQSVGRTRYRGDRINPSVSVPEYEKPPPFADRRMRAALVQLCQPFVTALRRRRIVLRVISALPASASTPRPATATAGVSVGVSLRGGEATVLVVTGLTAIGLPE